MKHKTNIAFANFMGGNDKYFNLVRGGTRVPMAAGGRINVTRGPVSGTPGNPRGPITSVPPTRGPVSGTPINTGPVTGGNTPVVGIDDRGTGVISNPQTASVTCYGCVNGAVLGQSYIGTSVCPRNEYPSRNAPELANCGQISCDSCDNGYPTSNMYSGNVCPEGTIPSGSGNPCAGYVVYGCMDPDADNYNEFATVDDGSCTFPSSAVYGCTMQSAENYDPAATIDDGSCTFSNTNVYGCTNPIADNYEEAATIDNGSCTFSARYGCTDENANNYNENATDDDGSCQYDVKYGCTDVAADNFDSYATNDDGSCQYTLSGGAAGGTGGTGGTGGGFPVGYGVGQGDIFPPVDSGIGGMGGGAVSPGGAVPKSADEPKEDMFKKYWWVLLLAAGGYYMYTKNKQKK